MIHQTKRLVGVLLLVMLMVPALAGAQSGTWEELSPMLIPRSEMPAAALDGKIYIVGGFIDILTYGTRLTNSLEVYDPATDIWTELAPMPAYRDHHTLAAYDGKLYSFGAEHFDAATYMYDPLTDEWTERAPTPNFRYGAVALALDDAIYIVGGVNRGAVPLLRYDPAADEWTERATPNVIRDHVTGVVLDGKLYALGGRNVGNEDYASIEIYDPTADIWTLGPEMSVPRAGFGAAVINGKIYVAGGEQLAGGDLHVVDSVEMFDPETETWEIVATLPRPLHGMPLISLEGKLYVSGGSARVAGIENHGELFVYTP